MSTTATQVDTQALRLTLADYDIHNSSPVSQDAVTDSTNGRSVQSANAAGETPQDWPMDHRRIPPHRPINYNLDLSQRFVFQNGIERAFVNTMFFGLRAVSAVHDVWCATGGRFTDKIFRYDIGGEY